MSPVATLRSVQIPALATPPDRFRALTGPEIQDGARLAARAFVRGFKRVRVLREGIGAGARTLYVFPDA